MSHDSNAITLVPALGGFDWLDKEAGLRRWFAEWLACTWTRIYSESRRQLRTDAYWKACAAMEAFGKTLAERMGGLTTAEQLAAFDAEARKFNFKTTREHVEDELRFFLTHAGQQEKHAVAFKASPWCDHFATLEHILEQTGKNMLYKLYPHDPDARLALESVISEFGSFEISRYVSPALSQLFAVRRALVQLDEAVKSLPTQSTALSAFRKMEPDLGDCSVALQAEINLLANSSAAFFTPLRERRLQRCVYFAVRRLCKPKDGPDKLACFVQKLLKDWPYDYAGMELSMDEHFKPHGCRQLIRDHLGLAEGQITKEARGLWIILRTIVFRDELRSPLLRLAQVARRESNQRRKGWPHLRKALRAIFNHIDRELSGEEMFRNFERANFAHMRGLTREQRMRLLPELGNDPDDSVRDLTKKERMILFQRFNKKSGIRLQLDPDGKNSSAISYGRAMKAVRQELGQD